MNRWRKIIALVLCLLWHVAGRGQTVLIPLAPTNGWQFLAFRKIPPNTFRASAEGLEIGVTNSAAPAIFPLAHPVQVSDLKVGGRISGRLDVSPEKQGQKGFDDYAVRIGLVEPGSRTLNWREWLGAADWVKKLFALAPRGTGISKIHLFSVGTNARQIGLTRTHPLSDLIEETIVTVSASNGDFAFTNHFATPLNAIAVWISSDGDDTSSSFSVLLTRIELDGPPSSGDK